MYTKIKMWLKSKKNGFLALAFTVLLAITCILPTSADDPPKVYNYELGRNVTTFYSFTSGEDYDSNAYVTGIAVNGNNYPSTYPPTVPMVSIGGQIGGDGVNTYNTWDVESVIIPDAYPYDYYLLQINSLLGVQNEITISLTDFYINVEYSQELETYIYDNIYFDFEHVYYLSELVPIYGDIIYDISYYDLLDINPNGTIDNYRSQGSASWDFADVNGGNAKLSIDALELLGADEDYTEKLYYVEYLTIKFDIGIVDDLSTHSINVSYDFQSTVEFDYNTNSYSLTTQSDFDAFRIRQFSQGRYDGGTIPTDYFRPYADWIAEAVSGFFSFQLFPGFYLGGIIVALVAFCLVMWWLKMFGGG